MKADGVRKEEEIQDAAHYAAGKIREGSYYQEALRWYHDVYHAPITDRAPIFVMLTLLLVISFFALVSMISIFPLKPVQSIVVTASTEKQGFPRMIPLIKNNMEDPNPAIQKWYLSHFVMNWESYNIDRLDVLRKQIRFLSEPALYQRYRAFYLGADSPAMRYERHTKREIEIRSVSLVSDNRARVTFAATEEGPQEDKKSLWRADITFAYEEIKVDQITNDITPMTFRVVDYKVEKIG